MTLLFCVKISLLPYPFQNRGNDFINGTRGIAFINVMCSPGSVAVVKDSHFTALSTGSILAHEIGHLFDMYHDDSECLCTYLLFHTN